MTALQSIKPIDGDNPRAVATWVKNPSNLPREIFIEPLASTLYILPHRECAVVTAWDDEDPPEGARLELADPITVWADGTAGNRIFRDDGNLVWDDAEPSLVYPVIPARLLQPLLAWARAYPRSRPEGLRRFLESQLAPEEMRPDLPLLLIEHGLLLMDEQGKVFDPRPAK